MANLSARSRHAPEAEALGRDACRTRVGPASRSSTGGYGLLREAPTTPTQGRSS